MRELTFAKLFCKHFLRDKSVAELFVIGRRNGRLGGQPPDDLDGREGASGEPRARRAADRTGVCAPAGAHPAAGASRTSPTSRRKMVLVYNP